MNITKLILPLLGFAVAAPASAVTWTTTNGISTTATGASIYCSTTTCNTSGSGLTGSVMTMRAYSTPNVAGGNVSPSESGNWINAKLAIYSGSGVGITNTAQSSGETSSPQHAIDNYLVNDILVVDFGSNNWDVTSFNIGWSCYMVSSGSSCSGGNVNVDAWVGGTSAIDFNSVSFSGSGSSATLPGFTALTLSPDPGGTGLRTDTTPNPQPLGRYLVITGNLAGYTDSFKISGISANQVTPPTGVPLPGTVPLFMLGLLALGFASRRRAVAARRIG